MKIKKFKKEHYWTSKNYDSRNYDMKNGYEFTGLKCKLCGLNYSKISNEIGRMFNDVCKNKFEKATTRELIFSFSDGKEMAFVEEMRVLDKDYILKQVFKKTRSLVLPKYEICDGYKRIIQTSDKDFVDFLLKHSYNIKKIIPVGRSKSKSSGHLKGKPIIKHGFFLNKLVGVAHEGSYHSESQRHDVPIYILELPKKIKL